MNSASETSALEAHSSPARLWPTRILGPRPGLKEMNVVCWAMFLAFLLVPMCVVRWIQVREGVGVRQLDPDFVVFYGFGKIAHEYPAARLYDYGLQRQVFTSISPDRNGLFYGPAPYPPFVALFFSVLTRFSFENAYLLWFAISLFLYLAGILATCRAVFPEEPLKTSLVLCLALAYSPFVFHVLLNGQLSAIAVCAIGLALYQETRGQLFRSGLALSLLAYKPTLLLFILPMLLLTRRFKTFLGFSTGTALLIAAGTAFRGISAWPAYVRLLRSYGNATEVQGKSILQLQMYIDFSSISHLMPGGRTWGALALFAITAFLAVSALVYLLWKSGDAGRPAKWLAWAATLTWTLLLNVYVPIYDSVLVILAIVLTLGALRDLGRRAAAEWMTVLAVAIFVASWMTERLAKAHGIPLLSIMLGILGVAELVFLYQAIHGRLPLTTPREICVDAGSTQ